MLAWNPKKPAIKSYCKSPIKSQFMHPASVNKNAIKVICRPLGIISTIAIVLTLCIMMYKPKIGNHFIDEKIKKN